MRLEEPVFTVQLRGAEPPDVVAVRDGYVKPSEEPMGRGDRLAIGIGILVFGLLILTQFLAVFSPMIHATDTGADQSLTLLFGAIHVSVTAEVAVLIGVMLAAMLGSVAYEVRQFTQYALRGELTKRAEWWYVLMPLQGAAVAAIVYLVLQGGLLGGNTTEGLNPYGIAAIAGLVGLFSRHAMQKLSEVFEKIFGTPDDKKVLPTPDEPSPNGTNVVTQ
jgi:hypothetical protein